MQSKLRKTLAAALVLSITISCAGCAKEKKEPRPTPKATAKVDEGNANASGEGEGQSDVPLVIACKEFSKNFNPFSATSEADKQAVELTQIKLVTNDRAGKLIYKGIDGELRQYGDENYTYYGATDLSVNYDEKSDRTEYRIKLRDDLVFSNGEKLTVDDIIFSLYVFCDNDYSGSARLKYMPIRGLLNYQANSGKAEKLSKKKVESYIRKKPEKLVRWVKKNVTQAGIRGEEARRLTEGQARILLSKGTGKKVKNISGIDRVNDYELTITTRGYCKEMSAALQIPICALHYYGDTHKYNVKKNRFGFKRGDISAILANRNAPLGAGAYRFVKLEDNVVYLTSNELYYLGCPQIAYLQLKDMTEKLKETKQELLERQEAEAAKQEQEEEAATNTAAVTAAPEETAAPVVETMELTEGVIDVISGSFTSEQLEQIMSVNSNRKLSGSTLETELIGDGRYHYIGIYGKNVSVGKDAESEASVNLRKALATVLGVCRGALREADGDLVRIVNYPVSADSWVSPEVTVGDCPAAYSKDIKGKDIFEDDAEVEEKTEHALNAALEYLERAGYKVEDGRVVKAPEGASLKYKVWIPEGEQSALHPVLERTKEALQGIGITLELQKLAGESQLQRKLKTGAQQLWVGSRDISDMNLEQRYGIQEKKNLFGIREKVLGKEIARLQNLMSSDKRKQLYKQCFDRIMELAVEVPVCEYRTLTMFSVKRIDMDTVPQDSTPYYSWMNEIQKVQMR